jgi:hypothetical protein
MKSFPLPATVAALAALTALPVSVAASGTLLLTAALGGIIHADYVQRGQRLRFIRRSLAPLATQAATPVCRENCALAA